MILKHGILSQLPDHGKVAIQLTLGATDVIPLGHRAFSSAFAP